jgi:hypothetical protein
MKLTKGDLKSIVKECLVELLQEGLGGSLDNSSNIMKPSQQPIFTEKRGQQSAPSRAPTSALREAVRQSSGGNRALESVLADTAATTLPKMLQSDSKSAAVSVPGGFVEQVVAAASPEQLFGEDASSRWANLAFAPSQKH